ncbi:MAG TPA: hypothetical protein VJB59_13965 [Bdellovibrionota bacterium]|nr:hypothetical protein [Bdellovibrionota bacterium]
MGIRTVIVFFGLALCGYKAIAGGGADTGGGNASKTTEMDIVVAVGNATHFLPVFIAGANQGELPSEVKEAFRRFSQVQSVEKLPLGKERPVSSAEWNLANSSFFYEPLPCLDDNGNERDASVKAGEYSRWHICISVSRLTRVPKESIGRTMAALVAHELTHEVGLGEAEAVQVQLFVSQMYSEWSYDPIVTCTVFERKYENGKIEGYQISFPHDPACTSGCVEAVQIKPTELGKTIVQLRTSLLGRKVGRDGGCNVFNFHTVPAM